MTDKEKIRAEIERRYKECKGATPATEYQEILDFIDSMQEEPVSEDLEEAARNYGDELDNVLSVGVDDDNSIGEYASQAFKAGAQWQKEQMMKEVKDGVITFDYYGDNDKIYGCIAHDSFSLEELGLKDGDKVKLIIIKEDEQ